MNDFPFHVEPQSVPGAACHATVPVFPDVVVHRPANLARQPAECYSTLDGFTYWTANAHVSNAIGEIESPWLRAWVCRVLNDAVLSGGAP